MYSAFFDESGTDGASRALVVSGVIASDDQWRDFNEGWSRTLDDAGVTYFHMRDFAHSLREFKSWKGDERVRSDFLKKLVEIIRRNTRHTFSTAVILSDYQNTNTAFQLSEYASPYVIAALQGAVDVAKWCNNRGYIEPVKLVFEDVPKYKGQFLNFYAPTNFHGVAYAKKHEFLGFQAADLIAWENRKVIERLFAGVKRYRQSYGALYSIPNKWGVYERSKLDNWCRNLDVPMRVTPR